jgi:hypothetical protein
MAGNDHRGVDDGFQAERKELFAVVERQRMSSGRFP